MGKLLLLSLVFLLFSCVADRSDSAPDLVACHKALTGSHDRYTACSEGYKNTIASYHLTILYVLKEIDTYNQEGCTSSRLIELHRVLQLLSADLSELDSSGRGYHNGDNPGSSLLFQ